jgi:hypothetical protein
MEKKTAAIIGLIGGILVLVGLALPWVSASVTYMGVATSMSVSGATALSGSWAPAIIVAVGGILALLGGLILLVGKGGPIAYLLPLGGILAIAGGIWAFAQISDVAGFVTGLAGTGVAATIEAGYGVYLGIVGAVLALIGSFALKK